MRQLLIECSEPGLVVSLAEELEHVLRHVDFARVRELASQLNDLANELGPEFEQVWRGFRLEMPNDGGHPPAFGNREFVDEVRLKELLAQAAERDLGSFELRRTMLLSQDGPMPETREQYIRDLADSIESAVWEEQAIFQMPVALPDSMANHRQQLVDEYGAPILYARSRYPAVGRRWIDESVKQLKGALREIDTRTGAVMEYELARLDPAGVELAERIRWAALAVRLGKSVEKWFQATTESLAYLYQHVALIWLLWIECQGWGPARPFLEKRLKAIIEQAEEIYTTDGVDALRLLYDDLHRPPWSSLSTLSAEEDTTDEGNSLADRPVRDE